MISDVYLEEIYGATSIIRTSFIRTLVYLNEPGAPAILVYKDTDKPRSDIRVPKVLRGIRFRWVSVDFVRLTQGRLNQGPLY